MCMIQGPSSWGSDHLHREKPYAHVGTGPSTDDRLGSLTLIRFCARAILCEEVQTFSSSCSLSAFHSPIQPRPAADPGILGSASHASRLVAAHDWMIPAGHNAPTVQWR